MPAGRDVLHISRPANTGDLAADHSSKQLRGTMPFDLAGGSTIQIPIP